MDKKIVFFLLILVNFGCYKAEVEDNQTQIAQLNIEIVQLKNEISRLSNLVAQSEEKILAFQAEITSLKSQISNLNSSISGLEDDIQLLNSDLSELDELLVLFDNYLKEVLNSFNSIVSLNEDSIADVNTLITNIGRNVEVIDYISSYLSAITNYQNATASKADDGLQELNSLIADLKSLLTEFSKVQNLLAQDLRVSLLGDIKVRTLLKGVNYIDWGEDMVPGTISSDCNWVRVLSDSRDNLISALHPKSNTLLLTHHSIIMTQFLKASTNDNSVFILNFLESPKKILNISNRSEAENSEIIKDLEDSGHSVDFLRVQKMEYGLADYPELELENLNKYQAILFYDGVARPSTQVMENLRGFVENPTKKAVFMGLGWVWSGYRSLEPNEPYPINSVFSGIGAKFLDWSNSVSFNINLSTTYYPETYNDNVERCN